MFQRINYSNRKLLLLILIISILGTLIGIASNRKVSAITDDVYGDLRVFTDVLTHLQKDYVEETENRSLIYGAIKGMLNTLDPHSSFMPPDVYRELQMETKGATIEELAPLISGKNLAGLYDEGDLNVGMCYVGEVVELIRDVKSCEEVIGEMVSGARQILTKLSAIASKA